MMLLVDVGNSRIKWAQESELGAGRVQAIMREGDLAASLDACWRNLSPPERIVAASVAGEQFEHDLSDWTVKHYGRQPEYIRAKASGYGIVNRYVEPERLGADRWAALVGAHHFYPGPACVIDCGTALTFNALTENGEFLGGAIMPGLTSARRCLAERTQEIAADTGAESNCIARKTSDAVAAGTAIGLAGAIERMVTEYRAVLGHGMRVIMTGGELLSLLPHVRAEVVAAPNLVLLGLSVIARATA